MGRIKRSGSLDRAPDRARTMLDTGHRAASWNAFVRGQTRASFNRPALLIVHLANAGMAVDQ